MLERVLATLASHGVVEVVLSLGYRPDAFLAAYPDGAAAGVRLAYAVEAEPLDTAGAIRFAADHAGFSGTLIVVNGDVLTDLDIGALVDFHHRTGAVATIALTPVEDPSRFGVVPTDAEGRVLAFVEKPPIDEAPTNEINAGTYVFEHEVLDRIPTGRRVSVERETFPALAAEGRLFARSSRDYWLDTGTPASYLQAHRDLLSGRRAGLPAPGAVEVAPGVWTLGTARIDGDVRARSLVGSGASVAAGGFVEGSVVGAGAVVEGGARVQGSVLLAGVRVGVGASVVDSVVGFGATVGPGAELSGKSVVGDGAEVPAGGRLAGCRFPDVGP